MGALEWLMKLLLAHPTPPGTRIDALCILYHMTNGNLHVEVGGMATVAAVARTNQLRDR